LIVDPAPDRHPGHTDIARSRLLGSSENEHWQEFVMVMNGVDTNFDGGNEIYLMNGIAVEPKRQSGDLEDRNSNGFLRSIAPPS